MARKGSKNTSDADWCQGLWEMARELGRQRPLALQIGLVPTTRKGVWRVTVRLLHVVDDRAVSVVVQTKGEYPNAASQDLLPYALQLTHEVDKLLAEAINSELAALE